MNENTINIYCDESHPMQNDGQEFMILGALVCKKNKYRKIKTSIQNIKRKNGLSLDYEFKWQKVGKRRLDAYLQLVDLVSSCDDLEIKVNLALGKRLLSFYGSNYNYDKWYHRMYYYMLKNYVEFHRLNCKELKFNLLIDKKDTHSEQNYRKIASTLNKYFKSKGAFQSKACNSREFLLIQLIDVIIGAISYGYKKNYVNKSKTALMRYIFNKFDISLEKNTDKRNMKFSLFIWKPEIREL